MGQFDLASSFTIGRSASVVTPDSTVTAAMHLFKFNYPILQKNTVNSAQFTIKISNLKQ